VNCPVCGSETETCSGLDDDDYTVWGDRCTNQECGWTNLYDDE
jgi:hypothetical protein